jgi:hypothetical protein
VLGFASLLVAVVTLVLFNVKNDLPFPSGNEPANIWNRRTLLFISVSSTGLLLLNVFAYVSSARKMIRTTQTLVVFAFLYCSAVLFYSNYIGNRFNSFGIAALSCFFFYIRLVPLLLRALLVSMATLMYCGGLFGLSEEYPGRYLSYDDSLDMDSMVIYIVKQMSLLVFLIFLQVLVVASHESSLLHDFQRDISLQKQTAALEKQKQMSKAALNRLLPPSITDRLVAKKSEEMIVDSFESVTILFTDMVGFTRPSLDQD